jgi:hypothetical protein
MTIEFQDGYPYRIGEYPPLTKEDFPSPAPEVVDALSPARSDLGGCYSTIAEAYEALDSVFAENAKLRSDLAAAQQARDTAQAQATHYRTYYTRSGW